MTKGKKTAQSVLIARARIIDESVPAPVLRFPVVSHDEVLRILADKPPRSNR